MQHPRFRAGSNITTGFIAEEYPDGFQGAPLATQRHGDLVLAAAALQVIDVERAGLIEGRLNGKGARFGADWIVTIDKAASPVSVSDEGDHYAMRHDDHGHRVVTDWQPGDPVAIVEIDSREIAIEVERLKRGWRMTTGGSAHVVIVDTPRGHALAQHMIDKVPPDLSRFLLCPMPGLVVSIDVGVGDTVQPGQPLAVVEAMKMQNILRAEKLAVVKAINAKPGDSLAVEAVILEFEAA